MGSDRRGIALIAYTALFAVFAWPWLQVAGDTVPRTSFSHPADERLIAYILAWGARALATNPLALFEMPINYPAPHQLTGSEHLLSTQLVFAPVFWITGNAVLSANAAVFVAYPLEALAMYWLARRLGCDRLVAFTAGLALALGAAQVPAHLHRLQWLLLYLPLVAGMLTQLRLEPSRRRTVGLAVACLLAFFSSYYTGVVTTVVAAGWVLAELCRPREGRLQFVLLAGGGVLVPLLVLGVFSLPYLARAEGASPLGPAVNATANMANALLAAVYSHSAGNVLRLLAAFGLVGLASRATAARTAARRGLVFVVVGSVLMLGPAQTIYGALVPLPYAALAASPLKFFRYPFRFVGLLTFGEALLVAGGLQAVRNLLPRWIGTLVVLGATAAIVTTRAPLIAARPYDTIEAATHPIYDLVARTAADGGGGALLELPVVPPTGTPYWTEGDTLIGHSRHWLPLVTGHTGYHPPQRKPVLRAITRLPAPAAIQVLVDMTHVRWVLLRPLDQWPPRLHRQREALAHATWASRVAAHDGWVLLRVDVTRRR